MIWLLAPTPVPLSPVGNLYRRHKYRKTEKERQLADGRWTGDGQGAESQKPQEESLVLYESFNTTKYTE
jgi:hypothetical protein